MSPWGWSFDFSKREKLISFSIAAVLAFSLRVPWFMNGNMREDCCLPELILQIFPAIQSLVISLNIFYQFQNKLTTIATFFTRQKNPKPRNGSIPFYQFHPPQQKSDWFAMVGLLGHYLQNSCSFFFFPRRHQCGYFENQICWAIFSVPWFTQFNWVKPCWSQ